MGLRLVQHRGTLALALTVVAWVSAARADAPTPAAPAASDGAVALLPLDADQRLELYGQPVASEVARALVAGGIDVVVVGPKMGVPERVRLIVDGTITAGKGDAVNLVVRIRDPRTGKTLDTLRSDAPALANIDRAAEDLSGRVLPSVRELLAAMHAPVLPDHGPPVHAVVTAAAPTVRPFVIAVGGAKSSLQAALSEAATTWSRRVGREPTPIAAADLTAKQAAATVAKHQVDVGVAFEVVAFDIDAGAVPVGRATVQVRIADGGHVLFDRAVVTDSVVGERGMTKAALAARVAGEILAIVDPHLRHVVAAWPVR